MQNRDHISIPIWFPSFLFRRLMRLNMWMVGTRLTLWSEWMFVGMKGHRVWGGWRARLQFRRSSLLYIIDGGRKVRIDAHPSLAQRLNPFNRRYSWPDDIETEGDNGTDTDW